MKLDSKKWSQEGIPHSPPPMTHIGHVTLLVFFFDTLDKNERRVTSLLYKSVENTNKAKRIDSKFLPLLIVFSYGAWFDRSSKKG